MGYRKDFNLYAYVRNDPFNRIDPTGNDSFLVARPLDVIGYANLGHSFVVTNARYIGDREARIISFGPLRNGNMGNISDRNDAAESARGTNARDARANGVQPHAYLSLLFAQLPYARTVEDFEMLLPWNVKAALAGASHQIANHKNRHK